MSGRQIDTHRHRLSALALPDTELAAGLAENPAPHLADQADFFGYRPKNFDMQYQGDVSIREALQLSLNVPAVRLLDAVGPSRLMVRLRHAGIKLKLPPNEAPGLAIALGGAGITLKDLVQLCAGLANREQPVRLGDGIRDDMRGDRLAVGRRPLW